jgi:acid phosphatase type 7
MSFLEQALKDARTDDTPWTIVSMHHPPYSWGRHGNDWASHIYLTPLFEKYKVDLVITAHDHVYSRTHPIIKREAQATGNNYTQGTGPIYAVLGGGGRPLYQIPIDPPPAWLAMGESTYHLGIIDASNTTIDFRAIRLDGSTLDTFQIHVSDAAATAESTPTFAWSLLVAGLLALAVFVRRRGPS